MKPITECKQQEKDYRQKMSACNVSYRLKRSGPKNGKKVLDEMFQCNASKFNTFLGCSQKQRFFSIVIFVPPILFSILK